MISRGLYERPTPARGRDGFFHPTSEEELAMLVRAARLAGAKLRVRGSGHSVAAAIYTDDARDGDAVRRHFDVMLDRYIGVTFDDARGRVTVQAGCHLGHDPRDPTGTSTWPPDGQPDVRREPADRVHGDLGTSRARG